MIPLGWLPLELLLALGLFFFNALISAAEIAMASLSRAKYTELSRRHPGWSRALDLWRDHPSQLLTTILVSSNLAVVALSSLVTLASLQISEGLGWPAWALTAASAALSVGVVLLSEIAPKVVAKRHPERVAVLAVPLLRLVEALLGPFIRLLVRFIRWLTLPLGGQEGESLPAVTEEELVHLLDEGARAGSLEKDESEMIQSVLAFGDTLVREVMVPRTRLDGISAKASVDECLEKFIDTGYTRLPVFEGDLDHIVGLLYAKDFLAVLKERELIILADVLRPAFFVPESKKVSELLREFRKGRIHLAVVVDEYGGTAGIVTLEDLVEEIVGEIRDEYDTEAGPVRPRGPGAWEVDAETALQDLVPELGAAFPEQGEATSLGGFVAEHLGRIPVRGDRLVWGGFSFEVLDASQRHVRRLLVRRLGPGEGA